MTSSLTRRDALKLAASAVLLPYADNLNWGQEAATRSANRVAPAIDAA